MRLVDHHRFAVEAMTVELVAGFVGIFGSHFHKSETVADNSHRENSADYFEEIFDGCGLSAIGKVPDQEFLCGCYSWHLNSYADM
jgi:hypothetical protein